MSGGWKEAVAALAYVLHFPPSEIWAMDVDDLNFWLERAIWAKEQESKSKK
jgi:hypothetical protein